MANHPIPLETVAVSVTEDALEAFEAALANACDTVGFFRNHDTGIWRVEGVKQVGVNEAEVASSLAVAAITTPVAKTMSLHRGDPKRTPEGRGANLTGFARYPYR